MVEEEEQSTFASEFISSYKNSSNYFALNLNFLLSDWFWDCLVFRLLLQNISEAATRGVLFKRSVPKNFAKFTGKHLCQTLVQVFSVEFCEISKNTYFIEHLRATAFYISVRRKIRVQFFITSYCNASKNVKHFFCAVGNGDERIM